MASARYWRIVGLRAEGGSDLELSAAYLYDGSARVDSTSVLTCTHTPSAGNLTDLSDVLPTSCRFRGTDVASSGFALMWDFGVTPTAVTSPLFGGANSARWLVSATLQYLDSTGWVTARTFGGLTYPGDGIVPSAPVPGDPAYGSVVALLDFDDTSLVDGSPNPKTLTLYSGAVFNGADKAVGAGSLLIPSSGYATLGFSSDFSLTTEDFTIEAFVYRKASSDYGCFVCHDQIGGTRGWLMYTGIAGDGGAGVLNATVSTSAGLLSMPDASGALTLDTWQHIALTRQGSTFRLFRAGVLRGTGTNAGTMNTPSTPIALGALWNMSGATGLSTKPEIRIDGLRITRGLARYTANFTPPAAPYPGWDAPPSGPYVRCIGTQAAVNWRGSDRPNGAARSQLQPIPFFDAYNGGVGSITGTVKEKGTPANTPLRRRVLLIDERSRITIRETWSDAVTGNYEFRGVREGVPYTVLSYDHTSAMERAVVADGQIPELIA